MEKTITHPVRTQRSLLLCSVVYSIVHCKKTIDISIVVKEFRNTCPNNDGWPPEGASLGVSEDYQVQFTRPLMSWRKGVRKKVAGRACFCTPQAPGCARKALPSFLGRDWFPEEEAIVEAGRRFSARPFVQDTLHTCQYYPRPSRFFGIRLMPLRGHRAGRSHT